MELTFEQAIVLHNLDKIQGERTIYSLYHLYQGKRSSQTIQDAHLYKLAPFFRFFPGITRTQLKNIIDGLIENDFAEEKSDQIVIPTIKGRKQFVRYFEGKSMPGFLNGWKYHQITDIFWERLNLIIQVCSNLIHRERHYIPVRNKKETLSWVKQYVSSQDEDRFQLAEKLYLELIYALDNENTRPDLIVRRLSGYGKIGLTAAQAAEEASMDFFHYRFEFLSALHAMLDKILTAPSSCPLLSGLVNQEDQKVPLTLSTEKTFRLLQKGYTLEEVAAARNLKESTIEDHVVEIVLSIEGFMIDSYVSEEKQERILGAARQISAKKLKQIRDLVEDAAYFEIRLVLAKYGDEQWN